jgi:hypothetical protein
MRSPPGIVGECRNDLLNHAVGEIFAVSEIPDGHLVGFVPENQVRTRLSAGGSRIRTIGSA